MKSHIGRLVQVNLERAGFKTVLERTHIVMSDGERYVTIPRHGPLNPHAVQRIMDSLRKPNTQN